MSTPARFGFALRAWLRSAEAYEAGQIAGTWTEGGCWTLAQALRRWAGTGELYGLWGTRGGSPFSWLQHVVWRHGELFFDGDGASRGTTLSLRATTEWDIDDVSLESWGRWARRQAQRDFTCSRRGVRDLAAALRLRFGAPGEWGFGRAQP